MAADQGGLSALFIADDGASAAFGGVIERGDIDHNLINRRPRHRTNAEFDLQANPCILAPGNVSRRLNSREGRLALVRA
jgi:hypothetical protein